MSLDADGSKDPRELNPGLHNENSRAEDGVANKETNLVEGTGLKANGVAGNVKDGDGGALQAPVVLQIQQQEQTQGTVVCWERFLHLRSIRVLLVENDDSTRHVVTALLRNCGYEVTEAANGLHAWKILEDLTHHIDLVLTEVVMPCLSGIGLLCKIMNHKTRKNVPVIMMSSHDSMGLVFKCLSKGAVDFLVKPIRKNELKNLWQHVWRRCHSSSGSGSESGVQTQKSVKSKSVEKSGNNISSTDEDDNGSIGLNGGDGSDSGSGTQSSWTKQAVEVESPQLVPSQDQVVECPDSTCAQVIHSNAEVSSDKQVPITVAIECLEQEEQLDKETGETSKLDLQLEYQVGDTNKLVVKNQNNLLQKGSSLFNENTDEGKLDPSSENPLTKLKCEAVNLRIVTTNSTDPHMDKKGLEAPSRHSKMDLKDNLIVDAKEIALFESSLKRQRGVKDVEKTVQDDRNVFRRSDSSAFSRYNSTSNAKKAAAGEARSGSPCYNGIDVTEIGPVCDLQCHSNCVHPIHCSIVGSNNIYMGSTTNNGSMQQALTPTIKCLHPTSSSAFPQVLPEKADDRHRHQTQEQPPEHDDILLKKMAAAAPLCGSSNAFGGAIEGNAANYSTNGSASGSNHGSNGQNGSSPAANAGGANVESDNGVPGKSGSGDASGSGSGNRVDQNKIAQREAALAKFRQKRKERCFRKKVRYQSRKKLAEQRPRVRGQFVRHASGGSTSRGTNG